MAFLGGELLRERREREGEERERGDMHREDSRAWEQAGEMEERWRMRGEDNFWQAELGRRQMVEEWAIWERLREFWRRFHGRRG